MGDGIMDKDKHRETILVIVIALLVAYWFRRADALLLCALGIGLLALFVPGAARGIHWGWMKLSEGLGTVSGWVLLTLVYILVLTPLSFLARWSGKIGLRRKPGGPSYFKERNHVFTKEDLQNPW
jgi:TRAP-type C4-dicarboxylate transport system permease small subunit